MAIIWGTLSPPAAATYAGDDGDVWISTLNNTQQRFRLSPRAWTPLQPTETRGDIVAAGGQLNDRLAKIGGSPYDVGWANAAEGVVIQLEQTTPARQWNLIHNLGFQYFAVTVVSDAGDIEIPVIEFSGPMNCRLSFAEDIAGIAIIRR